MCENASYTLACKTVFTDFLPMKSEQNGYEIEPLFVIERL